MIEKDVDQFCRQVKMKSLVSRRVAYTNKDEEDTDAVLDCRSSWQKSTRLEIDAMRELTSRA